MLLTVRFCWKYLYMYVLLLPSFYFSLLLRWSCFHGASVLLDDHVFFHLTLPLAFLSHLLFVFSFSHLFFLHQSLQGMLSSLHSELDIQRYLMKIQLPHRVSQTFYLICIMPLCKCVCGHVCILANICRVSMFPILVPLCLLSACSVWACQALLAAGLNQFWPWKLPQMSNCT